MQCPLSQRAMRKETSHVLTEDPSTESSSDAVATAITDTLPVGLSNRHNRAAILVGSTIIALLSAISLGAVLQGGSYTASAWLPLMIASAGLLLPIAIAGPPVLSGRVQKILLIAFGLQVIWTAASFLWADSLSSVWEETNRTLFYGLALVLAFSATRWAGRTALKALAMAVASLAGIVAVVIMVSLMTSADPMSSFIGGRLDYPVTYTNGLAALLIIGFWLALGLAGGARAPRSTNTAAAQDQDSEQSSEQTQSRVAWRHSQASHTNGDRLPRFTQPLFIVLATVILEVALLPQSRGSFWTFFLVLPFLLVLSPHRFRLLANVATVLVPVVLFWSRLNAPYIAITNREALDPALHTVLTAVGYSVAMVLGIWALTWLAEHLFGPLRRKATVWISVGLAALAIIGAAGGVIYADARTGGLDDFLGDRWQELTSDEASISQGTTRFVTGAGFNARLRLWNVATEAFREHPALGLGAQNFESYWYQHRPTLFSAKQPHSQPLGLLAELGIPGLLLWLTFIIGTLVYAVRARFKAKGLAFQATLAAMITGVLSWSIHSSVEWLWQLAGVTLPAMMLIGGLLAADTSMEKPPELPVNTRRSPTSVIVRVLLVLLALGAIASAAFPYLSSRYSAMAAGAADLEQTESRAATAKWLDPTSLQPYFALAQAHLSAASTASTVSDRREQLDRAIAVWMEALEIEPGSWVIHFQAAETLLAARDAAREALDFDTAQDLDTQARTHLDEAERLNPLSPEVAALREAF